MRRTIAAAALAAAAVLAVCAGTAWGHTGVERYVPGEGATVRTPAKVVGLRFEDGHRRQDAWSFRVR